MVSIITSKHPTLRAQSQDVPESDIVSSSVQKVITDMQKALHKEKFGVAIAAPQIDKLLRIFVVAGHVYATRQGEEYNPDIHLDHIYINPKIIKSSKKQVIGDEGCLSVPGKYGPEVPRCEKVTISYYDEHGDLHERGASSFLARVFQHEIDHLNGILYTDHALEVIDVDDDLKPLKKVIV